MNITVQKGRLTATPELKTTSSGLSVTSFSIAVDRAPSKQGERRKANFFAVTAWRSTAEFITRHFSKGDPILITGRLENVEYTNKNGDKVLKNEIVAEQVDFCGAKKSAESGGAVDESVPLSNDAPPESIDILDGDLLF